MHSCYPPGIPILAPGEHITKEILNYIEYIGELETYSWQEEKDNTPEDGHDHMVNSVQYGWIPYQDKIYRAKRGKE